MKILSAFLALTLILTSAAGHRLREMAPPPLAAAMPSHSHALRVQAGLEGNSRPELTSALTAGVKDRTLKAFVLGLVLGASGFTALADQGPPQPQVKPAPTGRLIWMLSPHGSPGDWDETVRRLKGTQGPAVLLLESGVPSIEMLRKSHPKVARQLTLEKLEGAKEDLPLAELKEILKAYQESARETLEKFRADPSLAPPLFRPLMRELSGRKDAKMEIELAPLESLLSQLRANLALEEAREILFRAGDTDAYLRLFAEQHGSQKRSNQERDWALREDRAPPIRYANPGATVFGQMGLNHFQEDHPRLGFNEEVIRSGELPTYLKVLKGAQRNALLEEEKTPVWGKADVRRQMLLYFPTQGLYSLLLKEGKKTDEVSREVDEMTNAIKNEKEIQELLGELRKRDKGLWGKTDGSLNRWTFAAGLYTAAWLNERKRLTPEMKDRLPPMFRNITLKELDGIYLGPKEEVNLRNRRLQTAILNVPFLAPSETAALFAAGTEQKSVAPAMETRPSLLAERMRGSATVWDGYTSADTGRMAPDVLLPALAPKQVTVDFPVSVPLVKLPEGLTLWVDSSLAGVIPAKEWGVTVRPVEPKEFERVIREEIPEGGILLLDQIRYAELHEKLKPLLKETSRQGLWITAAELRRMDASELAMTLEILKRSGLPLPSVGMERDLNGDLHRSLYT